MDIKTGKVIATAVAMIVAVVLTVAIIVIPHLIL